MNRRDFFSRIVPNPIPELDEIQSTQHRTRITSTGLTPYSGTWSYDQIIHLLRRTMFGAKMADINYFKSKTMSQAVDELLNVSGNMPAPPINNYNTPSATDPDVADGQTWVNANENGTFTNPRRFSFKSWWIGNMINQDRTILEKMTLFWSNHFATETYSVPSANFAYWYNYLLRKNAIGNFITLTREVTISPMMLFYLNGYLNTDKAPDENYARELQELFTLGKGPNSKYTESDVKEAAKILTGWRLNKASGAAYFDPNKHDSSNKQFSSFYNNKMINGKSGNNAGDDELDDLLTMIFSVDEVSLYICRKLYKWFVYYEIDSNTETNVIEPLAKIFRQNNYDIKPVLSALFKSEHFFDTANIGCMIKSPVDFCIGLCREYDIVFPDSSQYQTQYYMWNQIWGACFIQQQDPGDPPNVAGWPAYYQSPAYHETWINSDTLPKRNQISDILVYLGIKKNNQTIIIDCIAAAKMMSDPSNPNTLIDDFCKYLHILTLSASSKTTTKISILLSGQVSDYYWTNAWNDYINDPTNKTKKDIVNLRLVLLLKYLMNLSEYQLS